MSRDTIDNNIAHPDDLDELDPRDLRLVIRGRDAEIERLRNIIMAALDCLHHDDAKGARRILAKE